MKFLLDMPMPQSTATWLQAHGHDAVHARSLGLSTATDEAILQCAAREHRIVLTMDLDFPHLLSISSGHEPGVILVRLRRPDTMSIRHGLEALFKTVPEAELGRSIAVLEESRIRIHRLPIR